LENSSGVQISTTANTLQVMNGNKESVSFSLYSLSGQKITEKNITSHYLFSLVDKGAYIAKIQINNKQYSQKIVIK
jgi:hypothetical protein